MAKNNYLVPFLVCLAMAVILAIVVLLRIGAPLINCAPCEECETCPEERALLTTYTTNWFINTYNEDEIVYQASVYNYGYEEAKEVIVTCDLYQTDEDGYALTEIPLTTTSENVGNIASTSYEFVEISQSGAKSINRDGWYIPICVVTNCQNCDILDDRLPD